LFSLFFLHAFISPFKQAKSKCSCKKHNEFTTGKTFTVYKRSSRKISIDIENVLIDKEYLSPRSVYLCSGCADYVKDNFLLPPSEKRSKLSGHFVDTCTIIQMIENDQIEDNDLIRISNALGKSQNQKLLNESCDISLAYRSDDFLYSYNPTLWFEDRNPVIAEFLKGVTGVSDYSENNRRTLSLVNAYEHVLFSRNPNIVLPLAFSCNLVSYVVVGSKLVCDINAAASPSGCYYTVLNWIKEASAQPIVIPPEGDVITCFDNNQVMARNWRVRFDSKAALSVVTNILHIFPNIRSNVQTKEELMPSSWMYSQTKQECYQSLVIFQIGLIDFCMSGLYVTLETESSQTDSLI